MYTYIYIYIYKYTKLPTSRKLTNYNCNCKTGNLIIVFRKLLQDVGKPMVGGHITNESLLLQLFRKTDKPRNTKDGFTGSNGRRQDMTTTSETAMRRRMPSDSNSGALNLRVPSALGNRCDAHVFAP